MYVYELSEYQVYQLKSIDPALGGNWKTILISKFDAKMINKRSFLGM